MNLRGFLATGLFLATAAFGADAGLLNMVMPDAKVIAGIDVARARNTSLGQMLMKNMDADMAKFTALTGFDPKRDLTEIVMASVDTNTKGGSGLIIARGNFDAPRMKAFMLTNGFTVVTSLMGVDVFGKKGENNNLAFLDGGMVLGGETKAVQAAIARRGGGATLNATTYAKAQDMSRDNDIWMVTSVPVSQLAEKMPDSAPEQLGGMMKGDMFRGIEQAAMGVKFAAELINVTLEAAVRSEKDATAMADVVRFLSGMIQLNRDKPEMAGMVTALDSMKLTTNAKNVKMTLSVPQAEFEKMMNKSSNKTMKKI